MIVRLLHTLTDFASARRGKFVVMGVWLLLVLLLTLFAPKLANLSSNNTSQSLPANAPSQVAQDLLLRQFPANRGTPAILVFTDPAGLTIQDRSLVHQFNDWLNSSARPRPVSAVVSVYNVPETAGQLISADGTTMTLVVQLQGDPSGPQVQQLCNRCARESPRRWPDHPCRAR